VLGAVNKFLASVVMSIAAALPAAHACELTPGTTMQQMLASDRKGQTDALLELSHLADGIAIATPVLVDTKAGFAEFTISRMVKGKAPRSLRLSWDNTVLYVGCSTSAFFRQIRLEPGHQYIIYFRSGELLRAGTRHRAPLELSLRDELRLVAPSPAPNKSFKPTPLRGSA